MDDQLVVLTVESFALSEASSALVAVYIGFHRISIYLPPTSSAGVPLRIELRKSPHERTYLPPSYVDLTFERNTYPALCT